MLFSNIKSERDLEKLKKRVAKNAVLFAQILEIRKKMRYSRSGESGSMPTNAEMLALYHEMAKEGKEDFSRTAELLLRKIKTKSNSGVAVVSLLTMPFPCPGRCTYCPTEENMPKSYLSKEPAAARALANDFDPRRQIFSRLESLIVNGHSVDKIEMIIIGGTWSFYHPTYQEWFIKECFRACNEFGMDANIDIKLNAENLFLQTKSAYGEFLHPPAHQSAKRDSPHSASSSLDDLQKQNETAQYRIIGLSVETRPDYITSYEIARLRTLGVTKVEIGVQHLDDAILKKTKRDMKATQIAKATECLRNAGFKVVYHMMPNLPGSTTDRDIKMFRELFEDGSPFFPDMLKIYPCMVLEKSELYETWKHGEFRPYTNDELMHVFREVKKNIPPFVRIIRLIRDIPATYIQAGSKISNMRQWLLDDQIRNGWRCRCIRCREVRDMEINPNDFILQKTEYATSSGKEVFLSFENECVGKLAAFARLRLPDKSNSTLLPELKNAAIIRELHTYGRLTSIKQYGEQSQHIGFGRRLMVEAERIAKESGYEKLAVISGIGVREYYRNLGYELDGTYMTKVLHM